jgi:multidrug efflux pump subunit AcrB
MTHGKPDSEYLRTTHNTARFFVENRSIACVLLVATLVWGAYGYWSMPQRKDPDIGNNEAVTLTQWPGVSAEKVEQLVTRRIEQKIAENPNVHRPVAGDYGIKSITLPGLSIVYVELEENVPDSKREFNDISLRLNDIKDLPEGAGPIQFISDFGDTAALMLTIVSPKVNEVELSLRARAVRAAIEQARRNVPSARGSRFTLIYNFSATANRRLVRLALDDFARFTAEKKFARDVRLIEGTGFVGLDGDTDLGDAAVMGYLNEFLNTRLRPSEIHPDSWDPAIIRDPRDTEARLAAVAGAKYTYRELREFAELIQRTFQSSPQVSKVTLSGVLPETVYLVFSQERLASYGIPVSGLSSILSARNIATPGGTFEVKGKNLTIVPSGEFKSEREIGDVLITTTSTGTSVYLRDLVDVLRTYESPPRFLNDYTWLDAGGQWQRSRAVTLAVQMRKGDKIGDFGESVDAVLADLKQRLPEDLIMARTSDQPLQVRESVHLFMNSLNEAIILVVLVSWIGFWEWRSALLMALSIPITLAMTFGMMHLLSIDIQQVSIASLIIALGLLVDDPVVAGDAIKRELADGHDPKTAAWLGPTKLATAILYATITNCVAYLPFLMLKGKTGEFLYSLPVVITCALVASRLVSMTFIPLLGYYLLKPKREPSIAERRTTGFASLYYKLGTRALEHRWRFLAASLVFLVAGGLLIAELKPQFFPKDLSYLSYVDLWLPGDAPILATYEATLQAEAAIRQVAEEYGRAHPEKDGSPRRILASLTTFTGGGGPRFWFSVSPEMEQTNYAQIIIQVTDKHDTEHLIAPLQKALSANVPGARVDVMQLESGKPIGAPVAVRISGENVQTLRELAEGVKAILRAVPTVDRLRDDWGEESFAVKFKIDPDRANLAGVSNQDVAASSAVGMNGYQVTVLREGDKQIPVVARLRMQERAQLGDIQNLYVFAAKGAQRVPLRQVSSISYQMETQKIARREHFRTIKVAGFPVPGVLSSEVVRAARPQLEAFAKTLPPGYRMQIGGEQEAQEDGFSDLAVVMLTSVIAIFLALVFQFKSAVKPLLVFAAIPYGMVGALAALAIMGAPFGFMAFLGVASLIGVIVSHIIVLFDFIEERHELGEPLEEALLDAGVVRLRPVLITVGATITALFPLALHGGPLWEPMCYAQIGGLAVATVITLVLVPVLYAIFVKDLKWVRWERKEAPEGAPAGIATPS